MPLYEKNDRGHNLEHINYVIRRSLLFAKELKNINFDMVYTIASFHDIGHHIDPSNHEKVSGDIFLKDKFLNVYFDSEEVKTIYEAILDHRSYLKGEPRSIYGKIVSSADRNISIEMVLQRTLSYRLKTMPEHDLESIIEESRNHIINKFGNDGYARNKIYFKDKEYEVFLKDIIPLVKDKKKFKKEYYIINNIGDSNEYINFVFNELNKNNLNLSLDNLFYYTYNKLDTNKSFEEVKGIIKRLNNINELDYYLKNVNKKIKRYVEENIFPKYEKNDKAHGIVHILEVIRRAFALNETLKLNLDDNLIYIIASYHDLGKYINSDIHELIAAKMFYEDEYMKENLKEETRIIVKEAIEDHRSSKKDIPRTKYGKLISSADRNTSIEIVFIRSFFVGKVKMPDLSIEEYLEFTYERLKKRYSKENPENMFYEDDAYRLFLKDMRTLLENKDQFKKVYCLTNNISSRYNKVSEEVGEINYTR